MVTSQPMIPELHFNGCSKRGGKVRWFCNFSADQSSNSFRQFQALVYIYIYIYTPGTSLVASTINAKLESLAFLVPQTMYQCCLQIFISKCDNYHMYCRHMIMCATLNICVQVCSASMVSCGPMSNDSTTC